MGRAPKTRRRRSLCCVGPEHRRGRASEEPAEGIQCERGSGLGANCWIRTAQGAGAQAVTDRSVATGAVAAADVATRSMASTVEAAALSEPAVESSKAATTDVVLQQATKVRRH